MERHQKNNELTHQQPTNNQPTTTTNNQTTTPRFGSAWDADQKAILTGRGVSPMFFTTAGSLGSAGFTCAQATENEEVTLSCPYGQINA